MDLLIMGLYQALIYKPEKSTYAIRIFSSFSYQQDKIFSLKVSPNYIATPHYIFDDNNEIFQAGLITIDDLIASQMLEDFRTHKNNVECLLVHCTQGKNRSPAVAMAFNDIFNLGHNTQELMKTHKYYNQDVYKIIKETAEKLEIK